MICLTCAHSTPWKGLGFVLCRYLKAWEYRAERMACAFEPSRWEPRQESLFT
jgi:hypothetical protein